jgi:thioredoxin-dependent peroxiredoxin
MPTHLKEGDKAPAFSAMDQDGKKWTLKDFKGKALLLYFYPADDTPTCTQEACNLRDHFALLRKKGISVLGVSPDDQASHKKFGKKFSLPFPLLADPGHKIIDAYGVWGPKQLYGRHYEGLHRTSFLVDEKGVIIKIFLKPRSRQHSEEVLAAWETLGA